MTVLCDVMTRFPEYDDNFIDKYEFVNEYVIIERNTTFEKIYIFDINEERQGQRYTNSDLIIKKQIKIKFNNPIEFFLSEVLKNFQSANSTKHDILQKINSAFRADFNRQSIFFNGLKINNYGYEYAGNNYNAGNNHVFYKIALLRALFTQVVFIPIIKLVMYQINNLFNNNTLLLDGGKSACIYIETKHSIPFLESLTRDIQMYITYNKMMKICILNENGEPETIAECDMICKINYIGTIDSVSFFDKYAEYEYVVTHL